MYSRLEVETKDGSSQDGEFGDKRESPTSHFTILGDMGEVAVASVTWPYVPKGAAPNRCK